MYWPLGAPYVYAAPKQRNPKLSQVRNDNLESEEENDDDDGSLLGIRISRNGHLFATTTSTTLSIWQTSPVLLLTCVKRSQVSLRSYGTNVAALFRPDASIAAVQTSLGFLVTYHINIDPSTRVYQQIRSDDRVKRLNASEKLVSEQARYGYREAHLRFRMIIRIDAGIGSALALDDELVVATEKPAAVQCIRWSPENPGSQTSTELFSRLPWINKKNSVTSLVYDRAMGLFVWITNNGKAFAVQKVSDEAPNDDNQGRFFRGHTLHEPSDKATAATKAAINARFSLLAVGCANGEIHVYAARDYAGSLPPSHKLLPPVSLATSGEITFMKYSPDGYCLFAGFKNGWVMWSVYGKLGGSSFSSNVDISKENDEGWLMGVRDGEWINGGSQIILIGQHDDRLWVIDIARSAVTGCFGPANVSRMLLHTDSTLIIYRGQDSSDIMSLSAETSLWSHVQMPVTFLEHQQPIRCAVISPDGRYVAVAGRRGLTHYSVQSSRWKTFDSLEVENSFLVRGGMCWYQHMLITAVEADGQHELRLYSRELSLNDANIVYVEKLPSPAVCISPSGDDSLLVYTNENILFHYIIHTAGASLQLVQVGQIGLHGIVRAPARVRSVAWYIPEYQLMDGDPSQDVMHASVIFVVDAKLVLLQPSRDEKGDLKYDMKIIAKDVEYFSFTRDQVLSRNTPKLAQGPAETEVKEKNPSRTAIGLLDSLWYFDGRNVQCWPDFQDLLKPANETTKEVPKPIVVPADFYPASIAMSKGAVVGLEAELIQRRDTQFASFRTTIRTQLFLPAILRHYLSTSDTTSALSLSHHYRDLPYFSHALEILLHTVLDEEVDTQPPDGKALLPVVISFLSSFPDYLDILVQCTRKTEVRSWQTLFSHLPAPQELFEESLQKGQLKTAGGYLIILHTLEEYNSSSEQAIRLLQKAKRAQNWDLCKELARFLMALDESGDTLREAMERIDLQSNSELSPNGLFPPEQGQLKLHAKSAGVPSNFGVFANASPSMASSPGNSSDSESHSRFEAEEDYFPKMPASTASQHF